MKIQKIEGIKIIHNYMNHLIIKKEDYKALTKLSENSLLKLAKQFDADFYTNDGYNVEIKNNTFTFSYDEGYREVEVIKL